MDTRKGLPVALYRQGKPVLWAEGAVNCSVKDNAVATALFGLVEAFVRQQENRLGLFRMLRVVPGGADTDGHLHLVAMTLDWLLRYLQAESLGKGPDLLLILGVDQGGKLLTTPTVY